ncbi:MAG: carotenoid oxygenase family protein [Solirubrobacterales bacterium]
MADVLKQRVPTAAPMSHLGGFRSLENETRVEELPLEGKLPDWLEGSLIRTGPAKWEVGEHAMRHWFDGFAMLHRFGFANGNVSYANRFLQTRAYRAAQDEGQIVYSEFATDPCRSLFSRISSLFSPKISDNANVNLVELGERFIAMTETPIPVEFDPETLATAGVAYEAPGILTTAHPHLDRATGAILNYAAKLGPRNSYRFFSLGPGASEPELIAKLAVREPAYMHSFGLTKRWLVLAEFPFVVNPISIPLSGRPYIENYRWQPERGTSLTLIDRVSGEAKGPFETDPCFAFHHVNSFEQDGEVVVDVCAYDDATIVGDFYMENLRAGAPITEATLRRFRIRPETGTVDSERLLDDGSLELPRINYGRCNERPYRYVWGVRDSGSGWLDTIVRADLENRTRSTWTARGCYPGEPVFVPAPGARREDEGVLLSVVLDAGTGNSFLLVLDAGSLGEVARAGAPHCIPYGFHGQFAAAGELVSPN